MDGTFAVLSRHMVLYKRLWQASIFSSFILPVFFVHQHRHRGRRLRRPDRRLGLPVLHRARRAGVGRVPDRDRRVHLPGDGRLQVEPGLPRHAGHAGAHHRHDRWAGSSTSRSGSSSPRSSSSGVSAVFGAVHSPWVVLTPFVCALLALSVAAPVSAFSAGLENDSYFSLLFRFVVIPSTLFAGVFFPVEQLPVVGAAAGLRLAAVARGGAVPLGDARRCRRPGRSGSIWATWWRCPGSGSGGPGSPTPSD